MKPAPEAFMLLANYCLALGIAGLNRSPGCWEHTLGEWRIALNPHATEHVTTWGTRVPPFHALFESTTHMRMLLVSPTGGRWAGDDCEDDVISVLTTALRDAEARNHAEGFSYE